MTSFRRSACQLLISSFLAFTTSAYAADSAFALRLSAPGLTVEDSTGTPLPPAPAPRLVFQTMDGAALTSAAFEAVFLGDTRILPVMLANIGTATADLDILEANVPFAVSSTSCGLTLAPQVRCGVDIGFRPEHADSFVGSLTAGRVAGSVSLALGGEGLLPPAKLSASSGATLIFPETPATTTSPAQLITIRNSGGAPATFADSALSISAPFSIVATTCSGDLAPGDSCMVEVAFTPPLPLSYSGSEFRLTVFSNAAPLTIALSGIAGPEPVYISCAALQAAKPGLPSGVYPMRVGGAIAQAYCDMTTDGGGWTLVANQVPTALGWADTTADINPGDFGSMASTWRYGNAAIQALAPSTAWRITTDAGALQFLERTYFKPACTVSWVNTYDYEARLNSMSDDCQRGFTDLTFSVDVSPWMRNNASMGIGMNNSGKYCSTRFGNDPSQGLNAAHSCAYNTASRMQLWVK